MKDFLKFLSSNYKTVYYAVTTAVGVVGLILYVYFARRYKLRERDELCNVHYFAEEYYIQEEH